MKRAVVWSVHNIFGQSGWHWGLGVRGQIRRHWEVVSTFLSAYLRVCTDAGGFVAGARAVVRSLGSDIFSNPRICFVLARVQCRSPFGLWPSRIVAEFSVEDGSLDSGSLLAVGGR